MRIGRVMIAAPKSESGKTTLTCALLWALREKGEKVAAYKCGPDYIDPLFHEKVLGVPSGNLDTFFTDEECTQRLFVRDRTEGEIVVLEGVMGLFDGLGGIREEGSSYHLAKVTKTPIVLVVDAKGMGRSVVALLAGFQAYDGAGLIRGVILNRTSCAAYEMVKPLIEQELKLKVLGYFPEQRELHIESRHLGLVLPGELENIREKLGRAAKRFCETTSLEGILALAQEAEGLEIPERQNPEMRKVTAAERGKVKDTELQAENSETEPEEHKLLEKIAIYGAMSKKEFVDPIIAVARDEAFCFYYVENLRLLTEYGARLRYFSPLRDSRLPEDCCALLLGGGYPELYARQLSSNREMRDQVREAAERGMPMVAECGGFMYLHSALVNREGISYDMAGVLPGSCFDTGKLVRFGYVELQERKSRFLPEGERIKGHEFHYFDSTDNGINCLARKPVTGKEYPCVHEGDNRFLGFPHLYYPSNPAFAERFVKMAEDYRLR